MQRNKKQVVMYKTVRPEKKGREQARAEAEVDAPATNARKFASGANHMAWMECIGGVRGIESGVVGWYISGGELACECSNESLRSGGVCHGTLSAGGLSKCDVMGGRGEIQCA